MNISVVIPIYNAQKILPNYYRVIKSKLEEIGYDYEILFRDDASTDRSKDILEGISRKDKRVKVFSHWPNRGLGFTLRKLFNDAYGDLILYLDIDIPFGVEVLSCLIQETEKADVVLASRYAGIDSKIPLSRAISSRLYYWLCRILFGVNTKDLGSGLVIFKRKALENISLLSDGFDIHVELFTKIQKNGFYIEEIAAEYNYNGLTTFSLLRHGPGIFINTLRFWLKNR